MDWKINFSNGLEMEWVNRSISCISKIAADACYQDNIRPTSISFRREEQPWYSGDICTDLWRIGKLIYSGDLEALIEQLMFDLIDDHKEADYHPDIEDAFSPTDLEDMEDIAADPLSPQEEQRIWEKFEREFCQDPAELDPAELWKGFGI